MTGYVLLGVTCLLLLLFVGLVVWCINTCAESLAGLMALSEEEGEFETVDYGWTKQKCRARKAAREYGEAVE